jgi:hypothetical protein
VKGTRRHWTDDEILDVLRAEAEAGVGISRNEWERRELSPCSECIYLRFGSWAAALNAAGLRNPVPPQLGAAPIVSAIKAHFGDSNYSAIARSLDCDQRTVSRLLRGLHKTMAEPNADRILCQMGRPDVYQLLTAATAA